MSPARRGIGWQAAIRHPLGLLLLGASLLLARAVSLLPALSLWSERAV